MNFFVENNYMAEIKGKDIVFRIDSILKTRNEKRKAVADAVGISVQPFTSWTKRGSLPSADTIYYIAKYLDVSMEWLLTGEERKVAGGLPLESELREVWTRLTDEQRKSFLLQMEAVAGAGEKKSACGA